MNVQKAILLLFHCTLAIGLSLDNLPRRLDVPSAHRFRTFDIDDDDLDGEDYLPLGSKKRKSELQKFDFGSKAKSAPKGKSSDNLWDMSYSPLSSFRDQIEKREAKGQKLSENDKNDQELANILKDDDSEKASSTLHQQEQQRDRKVPPNAKKMDNLVKKKKKRESEKQEEPKPEKENESPDFQEWLRREYYRNMAKSFASMRKKRAMWTPMEEELKDMEHRRTAPPARASRPKRMKSEDVRFVDVTDSLKSIEDALLADALQVIKVIKDRREEFEDDSKIRRRITNDLNAAYDIETMRAALFRLKDNLYDPDEYEQDDDNNGEQDFSDFRKYKKRGSSVPEGLMSRDSPTLEQCPPLAVLTSDCAALGDTIPDDSLKELLSYACNWHEVCYSCGEIFGLNSDNCDMGFVEQSRTICRGDVPCESTAKLLLLPLRQRRVFYKRSNPNICLVDQCVEDFLTRV